MRYHGNYCGPGWSAGKYQPSVAYSNVRAVDAFDATCKTHDSYYSSKADPKKRSMADYRFYRKNIGKGIKRSLAALGVGGQALVRDYLGYDISGNSFSQKNMPPSRSRSSNRKVAVPMVVRTPKRSVSAKRSTSRGRTMKRGNRSMSRSRSVGPRKRVRLIGSSGSYHKARKIVRRSKYNKYGIVANYEDGGAITSSPSRVAYFGHGVAAERACFVALGALIKELAAQASLDIVNWNDSIPDPTQKRLDVVFVTDPSDSLTTTTNTINMASRTTWKDMIDAILEWYVGFGVVDPIDIQSFLWYDVAAAPTTASISAKLAFVQTKRFRLNFNIDSYMRYQNRTLASTNVNDANEDEADNIAANPLVGKVYSGLTKWSNGINMNSRNSGSATKIVNFGYADHQKGLIAFKSSDFAGSTLFALNKPPQPWYFGFKRYSPIKLEPGEIAYNKLQFSARITLNSFFMKMHNYLANGTAGARDDMKVDFGTVNLIGLEQMLDSRISEPSIAISFQMDQSYKVAGYYTRKVKTEPLNMVDDANVLNQ